jgi:preprotein translocase subunit SecG
MYTFLLVVHAIIAAALVAVILMQRSEGGSLGSGGNPGGLMSARGAADFLTRMTAILATVFVVMSILLAALATVQRGTGKIDASLAKTAVPVEASPAAAPTRTPAGDTTTGSNTPVPLAH